jgi:ribulose-phosphate 3-epimerase
VHYTLQAIRDAGCGAGLALCPATPPIAAAEVAADLDVLLCMTVNPGWGGQAFIPASLAKLERLSALVGPATALEVDGGIDARTAAQCAAAGATLFVAGTSVFGSPDPASAVQEIATAAQST